MTRATPEMIAAAWATWHSRHGGKLGPGPAFVEAINAALALQSAAEAPPPQPNVEQWRPWIDMPVGDQRGVVREVRSENGETALAYWTGEIMALAPVSDNPVPLPFKVWGQRPVQQSNAADLERQAHPPAEHLTPEQSAAITDYRETMASLAWPQTSYQTVTAPVSPAPQDNVAGVECTVQPMKTSGGTDYYVHLRCGDRTITPHMFVDAWKAEYEVAEWKWFFGQSPKPDLLAYGPRRDARMSLGITQEWFERRAKAEADLEIGAGFSIVNPTDAGIAQMEVLAERALPQWAQDELSRLRAALAATATEGSAE